MRYLFPLLPLITLFAPLAVLQAQAVQPAMIRLQAAAGVRVEAAPLNEQEQQNVIRQALIPTAKQELSFLKRAAELSDEQMQPMRQRAIKILTQFSTDLPETIGNKDELKQIEFAIANGAKVQARRGVAMPAVAKLHEPLKTLLQTEFKTLLSDTQQPRYEEELALRDEYNQQAIIEFLIVVLDDKLTLTPRQSEQIAAGMKEHWAESWAPQTEMMANYGAYFPPIPDSAIVPYLEKSQQQVWSGAQKVRFGSSVGVNANGLQEDFDLNDPPAQEGGAP